MTFQRWHWLCSALVAGGLADGASAQAPQVTGPQAIQSAPCAGPCNGVGGPFGSFWHRAKDRPYRGLGHHYDEIDPLPLGTSVYQTMTNQIDAAVAVRMILHDYDFEPGTANLRLRGKDLLPLLGDLALRTPYRLVIERTPTNNLLAEQRRVAVLEELARLSIPLPHDRVVVGPLMSRGLYGVEANILYFNQLQQTLSSGTTPSTATAGTGITAAQDNAPNGGGGGAAAGAGAGVVGGPGRSY